MIFPQIPFRFPFHGRFLHGIPGYYLICLIGMHPVMAQGVEGSSAGFFDRVEVEGKLGLDVGKLQSPLAWKNLWRQAQKRGPLCESALEKEFEVRHGIENRLALLGGFCLAGRKRAAKYLENWYRAGRRIPEELVFLCLGSASGGLPLRLEFLQSLALSKKNPQVVRLAAAIALIERQQGKISPEIGELFAEQPEGLFVRLLRDQLQSLPNFGPDARTWVFKGLRGTGKKVGSGYERLAKTLAFLNLASVPNALEPKQVMDLLAREIRYRPILSLVRGLQLGNGALKDLQVNGLSLPHFFAGLREADESLQQRILEGPGGARGSEYNQLWWATGARLISQKHLAAFARASSRDPGGEKGLRVLLWRVLVGGNKPPPLPSFAGGNQSLAGSILLYLNSRRPQELKTFKESLSPRIIYALKQLFPFESGVTPKKAPVPRDHGRILWDLLGKNWSPRGALPGTAERFRLHLLSQWVADLFIGGSSFAQSRRGISPLGNGYLPKGVRGNRQAFFRILHLFLNEHPFFGV
jgi:hypothetical protein